MNYERVKAVFLSLLDKKEATPYIMYIEAAISDTEGRIRPEFAENPPDCVNMLAAANALVMYTNALCAGDITVCNENGKALIDRNTENTRRSAAYLADYFKGICSRYITDDKFVMISTEKEA